MHDTVEHYPPYFLDGCTYTNSIPLLSFVLHDKLSRMQCQVIRTASDPSGSTILAPQALP